ncbi:MAG: hypothetical protein K9I85_06105 [Saprospiraceae bacterium]|nr:hypothetical protein [Saprospiraceae bacterium]
MNTNESLLGVLQIIYQWRKRLVFTTLGVGVATALISLLLANYYQATTTFYAANSDLTKPDRVFGPPGSYVEYFGSGADIDRLLTIASGKDLLDRMIDTFDLFTLYHIDPQGDQARERARLKLSARMEVNQTKYDGMTIRIEDTDPNLAAEMANMARNIVDQMAREHIRNSQKLLLNTYQISINEKQSYLVALADSLEDIQRNFGVYDYRLQYQVIGDQISRKSIQLAGDEARLATYRRIGYNNRDTIANISARVAALQSELADLNGTSTDGIFNIRDFAHGATLFSKVQQQFENTKNQLSYDIEKANHLTAAMNGDTPAIIPFERAIPPQLKARPKRAFMVISAMALTLIFGILYLLVRRQYQLIDWKQLSADGR